MTMITDFLPFLSGWKYAYLPPTNYVIPAGQFQQVYDSKTVWAKHIDGFILGLGGCMDVPTATLEILHSGPQNQQRLITGTPFALNAAGLQYPNPSGFWHGTYNALIPNYCAFYHPMGRLGTFVDYMRIRILAPAALAVNVTGFWYSIIEVHNRKEWRRSLHKLLQSNIFHIKSLEPQAQPQEPKE